MKEFLQNSRKALKKFFSGGFFAGFIVSLAIFAVFVFFIDLNYQSKLLKRTADMELILRSEKESHDAEVLGFIIKIKQIIQATPNDQELGAKIRELAYKTELLKEAYNKSSDD